MSSLSIGAGTSCLPGGATGAVGRGGRGPGEGVSMASPSIPAAIPVPKPAPAPPPPAASLRAVTTLLVANRGEIARRIVRTAKRMGIATVAVFSDADADAPHVREADRAFRLGPAPASASYLSVERIVAAAHET